MPRSKRPIKFKTTINHFHILKRDADYLVETANRNRDHFEQTIYSRVAIITYVLCLEALINRVIDIFWPSTLSDIFKQDISKWKTVEKWEKIPKLFVGRSPSVAKRPYQYLKPLFQLRNDYVHSWESTYPSILEFSSEKVNNMWTATPSGKNPKYEQIALYKDPSQWLPDDATRIKTITEELIAELDALFEGRLSKGNWLNADKLIGSDGTVLTVERGIIKEDKNTET